MENTIISAGMPGVWQIVLIAVLILLLFGGKKIPEMMKGLGQGMKEFKNAVKEPEEEEIKSEKTDSEAKN
ncbi:MAG: twin-arginine translocase TatA/TatE family subunit [Chlorobi bacterium]|nr:twin-arginine translocase TatA/TatE family subunit [Chlorobiota bacterium]